MRAIFFLVCCLICIRVDSQNQTDTAQIYRVEMLDGNEFIGSIISDSTGQIELKTANLGILKIDKALIKEIELVESAKIIQGKLWFDNPQAARYYWAPNGYGLKKGEGYYQNIWVLFNQVSVGITNNISIGAGVMPLFLFGSPNTPLWVTPKVSFPVVKDKVNLGVGTILFTITGDGGVSFGILYGTATLGSRNENISLGLGFAYNEKDVATIPIYNISGMLRCSQRFYLITENYLIMSDGETVGFFSGGGRSITKRVAIDYGLFIPFAPDIDKLVAIPWLGITVPF